MRAIDNYYLQKEEPVKSCLLFLRDHILNFDKNITEAWKYGMPFFCYNGKMFCYLWVHKKNGLPYIGIVEGKKIDHPALIMEDRARMKIMLLDPTIDLPIDTINFILNKAISFYD
ncbi:MAG: hypothetical protein JWP37_3427 [Mucilaginibacter sp.]|nr:hypothetical protein [Mucilaginibacter sp.]